jgi:four helix bundle protein
MKDFKDQKVWERAHQLTLRIYTATSSFPKEELDGLTGQIRRCSASIAAAIAEGYGQRTDQELHRFLAVASGLAGELDYYLLLAHDLKFLNQTHYQELSGTLSGLRRMLTAMIGKSGS